MVTWREQALWGEMRPIDLLPRRFAVRGHRTCPCGRNFASETLTEKACGRVALHDAVGSCCVTVTSSAVGHDLHRVARLRATSPCAPISISIVIVSSAVLVGPG
jgi:hypothetical protein